MSQRSGDLFTSRHDAMEGATNGNARPPPVEEEEVDMNPLQLEHMLGYAGDFPKSILAVPNNENLIVKSLSSLVSIEDMTDPHSQRFLRGHDMPISALAVSKSGTLIASSQIGTKYYKGWAAPVFIWQASTGKRVVILKGLSVRANLLSISDDERFLCGCDEDSNMIIWDLVSSEVVGSYKLPVPATVLMWADQRKQVHSVDYELVVGAGNVMSKVDFKYDNMRMQWSIKLKAFQMPVSGGIIRTFKCGCITANRLYVCAGTTGGEMMVYRRDTGVFRAIVPVCTNGLNDMVCFPDGTVYCGGGDGTVSRLELKLDYPERRL
jgi:WD40 repeat protein